MSYSLLVCDPAERCVCDDIDLRLHWPMHWRPDVAPPAPWPWLDARAGYPARRGAGQSAAPDA